MTAHDSGVFSERHGVLDGLTAMAHGAAPVRIAVVTGEAGSGKSTLLRAFLDKAADGADVLYGRCDPFSAARPLAPLFDLARSGGVALTAPAVGRAELFDGFLTALRGRTRPAILALEDVHWADDATLDLLSFVARRLDEVDASIVVTYRDEEIGGTHGIHAVLAGMPTDRIRHFPLPALAEKTIEALAAELSTTVGELRRQTGGNPLLIGEIARHGDAAAESIRLRALVASRLAVADPAAIDLVNQVSVSPDGVEAGLLAGREDLLDTGLLEQREDRLFFRHELLRRVVERALPEHRRRALHRRLLAELSTTDSADTGRLIRHARACGDLVALAGYHRDLGRMTEARAAASDAESAAAARGASTQLVAARCVRAELDVLAGRYAEAEIAVRHTVDLAGKLAHPLGTAQAEAVRSLVAYGKDPSARPDLLNAVRRLQDHGKVADAVRFLTQLCSDEAGRRELALCDRDLVRAFALATGHRLATRQLLSIRSWSRFASGDWARAEEDALAAGELLPARCVLARLNARRGGPVSLAANTDPELPRDRVLLAVARAESAWLSGDRGPEADELRPVFRLALRARHPWYAGELALWLRRAGEVTPALDWFAEPYRLLAAGQWRRASDAWTELGCAYESADSLAMSGEQGALRALEIFDGIGAGGAARRVRQYLRRNGVRRIPRGPRPATAANPAGLTRRQAQVLTCVASGLSNAGIAERMHLSVRTVDHHVAAILTKLAVGSRRAAVSAAIDLGILPEFSVGGTGR
ncbi:LuxR C-terminal-related transcriptional regulator [Amycolatopsis orientalis]|uniref:LuxR C-terminal-related transcriptional regulator n=1 Tax=Amycolatopsis orientalis TaxID=31958 RepID=UPI0009DE0D89|nr:LuxR family transcriptional regulator [Amycolatopsis orientalis]